MKTNLTVVERANLLTILPETGDFLTLKILRKIRERLALSEEEIKFFDLKYAYECKQDNVFIYSLAQGDCPKCNKPLQMNGGIVWNPKVKQDRELEFGEIDCEIIKTALKKLNDTKQLSDKHFSLYEKFVSV